MKRRHIITFLPAPIGLTFMQPCIPFRSVDSLFLITAKTLMGTIYTLAFSLHFIIYYSFKSLCSDLCPCHSVQTTPANVTNDLQDIVNVNRWFSCPRIPLSLDTIGHSSLKSASLGFCYFLVFLFFSCSFSNSFRGFSIVAYLWMELTGKSASIQTSLWTLHLNFHLPSAHFHWLS